MKKLFYSLLLLTLISCNDSPEKEAVDWHNKLIDIQDKSFQQIKVLREKLVAQQYDQVTNSLEEASKVNAECLTKLQELEVKSDGVKLKESVITVLNSYQAVYQTLPEFISIIQNDSASIEKHNASVHTLDSLFQQIDTKTDSMLAAQKIYLTKFNLHLESDSSEAKPTK